MATLSSPEHVSGPFVRISPNEIHVNDPDFYNKLYSPEGRWNKFAFTYQPFAFGASAFTALGHDEHQRRRQPWNAFFTKEAVSGLELTIKNQIERLSSRIEEFVSLGEVLPIGVAYSAMTMDITTVYATGSSYGNLDRQNFNQPLVYCFAGFGPVWRLAKHIPWLVSVFMMFPSWMMTMLSETTAQYRAFQEVFEFPYPFPSAARPPRTLNFTLTLGLLHTSFHTANRCSPFPQAIASFANIEMSYRVYRIAAF